MSAGRARAIGGRRHDVLMEYLEEIDTNRPDFWELYDELPLWSAPFGLLLLDRVPIRAGITILDVGAGTGFMTLELAQRCGPTTTVIAVDPWAEATKRLRLKLDGLGLRNVRLIEQDAAEIDLPDASVDLVVSNLGINNFENAAAVLRTCCRVTKPDGRLLLATNLVGHMREFYEVYEDTLRELSLADRLPVLEAHVNHRGTEDSVGRMLEHAGFEVLGATRESFRMRFADGSTLLRHHFIRLGFLPGWKSVVAPSSIERTFEALERRLNAVASRDGELTLTVPMACIEARKPAIPAS